MSALGVHLVGGLLAIAIIKYRYDSAINVDLIQALVISIQYLNKGSPEIQDCALSF